MSETGRQLLARVFRRGGAMSLDDYRKLDAELVRLEELRSGDRVEIRQLAQVVRASAAFFVEVRPLLDRAAELAAPHVEPPCVEPGDKIVVIASGLPASAEGPGPMPAPALKAAGD